MRALIPPHLDLAAAVTVTVFEDAAAPAHGFWRNGLLGALQLQQHRAAWCVVLSIGTAIMLLPWLRRRRSGRSVEVGTIPIQTYPVTSAIDPARSPLDDHELDEETLRSTLADLVRENPDNAAQILHQWLKRAG